MYRWPTCGHRLYNPKISQTYILWTASDSTDLRSFPMISQGLSDKWNLSGKNRLRLIYVTSQLNYQIIRYNPNISKTYLVDSFQAPKISDALQRSPKDSHGLRHAINLAALAISAAEGPDKFRKHSIWNTSVQLERKKYYSTTVVVLTPDEHSPRYTGK